MTLIRIGLAVGVAAAITLAGCDRKPFKPGDPTGAAGSGVGSAVGAGSGGGTGGVGGSDAGGAAATGGSGRGGGGGGQGGGIAGAAGSSAGASGTGGVAGACAEACASPLVCERNPPPACADPQWVAWPMPNTKADVAAGAPNEMSLTDNGDGTVTDNVTRLMWQQATPPDVFDFTQARAFCRDLTFAGHDDWRLPSMIELVSIADLGRSSPAIDTTVFPGTPSDPFWSSTIWGTSPTTAMAIFFDRGSTRQQPMEMRLRVRCVR